MNPRLATLLWLAVLALAGLVVARLGVETDMSAFLPRDPSPAQRVLVDQLRDGVASRVVLVAVEGADTKALAAIDRRMVATLREDADFASVEDGEETGFGPDRAFLWDHRYLLTDPGDMSAAGLRAALARDLAALGSSAGFLVKQTLAADPTGAMLRLLTSQMGQGGPATAEGVWVGGNGARALLLARLRTQGSDLDGAERALAAIRAAFAAASPGGSVRLVMTGPPVFAVDSRARIKSDATRLSTLASLLVAALLLVATRSPLLLALSFVPVASGALVGVAAVGLVFRKIHGITLGFGATLIGEAVDYAVYLFSQTASGERPEATLARIWPVLRLGVLTSIAGFSAMLLSRFDGFAQLGVFTIAGLATAAATTGWVLPGLVPRRWKGARLPLLPKNLRLRRFRLAVPLLAGVALVSLVWDPGAFWAGDLASLSPVPPAMQRLDRSLRHDMGAPDAAYLVSIHADDAEGALRAAEAAEAALAPALADHRLAGLDSPARVLPSLATQRARQRALPAPETLAVALAEAEDGIGFQPNLFAPFLAAIAQARGEPLLTRESLANTSLSLRLDTLLLRGADGWTASLPLRGLASPAAIAPLVARVPGAVLIDLKGESDRLLAVYLREGVSLASLGTATICLLLLAALRSWTRLVRVLAPLAAAVVVTLAALRLGGHALSIFNLFGLLLVVAIGSNYALFLERPGGEHLGRLRASLLLANLCTIAGFGVLATSGTPVLHDLGLPVAMGSFFSLVFATVMLAPSDA